MVLARPSGNRGSLRRCDPRADRDCRGSAGQSRGGAPFYRISGGHSQQSPAIRADVVRSRFDARWRLSGLSRAKRPLELRLGNPAMRYISTRGGASAEFGDVLLGGPAADGGLYLPDAWPRFHESEIATFGGQPYAEVAFRVMRPFVAGAFDDAE